MAPHSSTLAWKIPWMEPGRLQSMGSLRVRHDFHFSLSCIGEGNGNPLQCSCLENPRDGEAWWAAVYGVTQSRARLKWLSNNKLMMQNSHGKCLGLLKFHLVWNKIFPRTWESRKPQTMLRHPDLTKWAKGIQTQDFPGGPVVKTLCSALRQLKSHMPLWVAKNSTDRGAWWATVRGITKSRTQLSD